MRFDFNLKNGICCQERNGTIVFFEDGEQKFFYSVPPKISKEAAQKDCGVFLAAKGLLKVNSDINVQPGV